VLLETDVSRLGGQVAAPYFPELLLGDAEREGVAGERLFVLGVLEGVPAVLDGVP